MGKKAHEDNRDVFEKALDDEDLASGISRVLIGAIQGRIIGKALRRGGFSPHDRSTKRWDNASTAVGASLGGLGEIVRMDQKIQERRK